MSEKVKVSVFLEPGIVKAGKMQAAREGCGLSEIVRNVFVCAHCGEPITDEFVVGSPKLIAANGYGVFFHRNRNECLEASGPKVAFVVTCPHCKTPTHQDFERATLFDVFQKREAKFYCNLCDSHWSPTPEEAGALAQLLGAKSHDT